MARRPGGHCEGVGTSALGGCCDGGDTSGVCGLSGNTGVGEAFSGKKVSSEASGREARVGGQTGTDVGQMGTDVGKTFQIDQGQAGKPCKYS